MCQSNQSGCPMQHLPNCVLSSGTKPARHVASLSVIQTSARKRAQRLTFFWSGDCPVRWGSSTRRAGGRKVLALPRKFVFLGFRREEPGLSREFCRDVLDPWGCSKSLCQKSLCAFFGPLNLRGGWQIQLRRDSLLSLDLIISCLACLPSFSAPLIQVPEKGVFWKKGVFAEKFMSRC